MNESRSAEEEIEGTLFSLISTRLTWFEDLLVVDQNDLTMLTLEMQLQNALKLRHDTWVDCLFKFMSLTNKAKEISILSEYCFQDLVADLAVVENGIPIRLIEVTITLRSDVLKEKGLKYDKTGILYYISDTTTSFEQDLPNSEYLCKMKKRFLSTTSSLLQNFQDCLRSYGISNEKLKDTTYLTQDNSLFQSIKWNTIFGSDKMPKISDTGFLELTLDEKIGQIADVIKLAVNDEQIRASHSLTSVEDGMFSKSYSDVCRSLKTSYTVTSKIKPFTLFYAPLSPDLDYFKSTAAGSEQSLITEQLRLLSRTSSPIANFSKEVLSALSDATTRNMFDMGLPLSGLDEPELRHEYQEYLRSIKPDVKGKSGPGTSMPILKSDIESGGLQENMSFLAFISRKLGTSFTSRSPARKVVDISKSMKHLSESDIMYLEKSMTGMSKETYVKEKLKKYVELSSKSTVRECIMPDEPAKMFLSYMNDLLAYQPGDLPSEFVRMLYPVGVDLKIFKEFKQDCLTDFQKFLLIMNETPMLRLMANQFRLMNQLLHHQSLTYRKGHYSFFNSGLHSTLYIVQHGLQDKGKDVGRAYMIVRFGCIPIHERKMFGFSDPIKIGDKEVQMTSWRRLSSQRVSFHMDQLYSVLSTTYASYSRKFSDALTGMNSMTFNKSKVETKKVLATRILVSLSHRQLAAEMLSDMRYLYMDSFSDFACVQLFIKDKFTRPIQTCFESFLLSRIPLFDKLRKEFKESGVTFHSVIYHDKQRDSHSLGGKINLSSVLHPEVTINHIQDLLDDMFLYVHTNKDPSSPYHEYVKAMNTIIDFQSRFDSLSDDRKNGKLGGPEGVLEYLRSDNGVGFWDKATHTAAEIIASQFTDTPLEVKINNSISQDTLLDMNSTKSIIPERARQSNLMEYDDLFIDEVKNVPLTRRKRDFWDEIAKVDSPYSFKVSTSKLDDGDKMIISAGTNRTKVHDSTLDILERHGYKSVFQLARWNINRNNSRVHTDICIKAQYGAKREFYVINHGAKAMARLVESGYKILCKNLQEEMISVPGDTKMFNIQELLDRALLQSEKKDMKVYYCNGDCTKWSAAETMQCLSIFNTSLANILGHDFTHYTNKVLSAWADKTIQMPPDLVKNVFFKGKELERNLNKTEFKSTQNFLQGMFNHLSSAKAVGCSELTRQVWSKLHPNDTSAFYHMEHSDDYAFIFVTEDDSSFKEFKLVHRILMRCLGISDSKKKTNCQQFLLEFISLMSFNGVMTYPTIKKVKEIGLNIGCMGYSSDLASTSSRVGEACRMGVPSDVAYIMSRIQNVRIASAYGLFTENKSMFAGYNFNGLANIPIQLWGVPDMHPMFYLFTKGDCNNHRLYTFSDNAKTKDVIKLMYTLRLSESNFDEEDYNEDRLSFKTSMYHPKYKYLSDTKLLKAIRKSIPYNVEDAASYWEKHPLDAYLKPKSQLRFKDWMYSKYFQRSFSEAYMRTGRAQLQLRLSHFVKQKCMLTDINNERFSQYGMNVNWLKENNLKDLSIKDTLAWYLRYPDPIKIDNEKVFLSAIQGFDPTVSLIYDTFKGARYTNGGTLRKGSKAFREPVRQYKFTCKSNPVKVLQYMYYKDDFKADYTEDISMPDIIDDVEVVNRLLEELSITDSNIKNQKLAALTAIIEILSNSKFNQKPLVLMENPSGSFLRMIKDFFEYQSISNRRICLQTTIDSDLQLISDTSLTSESTMSIQNFDCHTAWLSQDVAYIDDLVLMLFYNLSKSRSQIQSIFKTIHLRYGKLSASEYLNMLSNQHLTKSIRLSNKHVQALGSLQDIINDDNSVLLGYLKSKLGYQYKYSKSTPRPGLTTIYIRVMSNDFVVIFKEHKDILEQNLTILTTCKKMQLYSLAYNIAQRLCGNIGVNQFVKRTNYNYASYIPATKPVYIQNMSGTYVYRSSIDNKFTLSKNSKTDIDTPIYLVDKLDTKQMTSSDNVHVSISFDHTTMSGYSRQAKVYTLHFNNYIQTNAWCSSMDNEYFSPSKLLKDDNMQKFLSLSQVANPSEFLVDTGPFNAVNSIGPGKVRKGFKDVFRLTDPDDIVRTRAKYESRFKYLTSLYENPELATPSVEEINSVNTHSVTQRLVEANSDDLSSGFMSQDEMININLQVVRNFLEWTQEHTDLLSGTSKSKKDRMQIIYREMCLVVENASLLSELNEYLPPSFLTDDPDEDDEVLSSQTGVAVSRIKLIKHMRILTDSELDRFDLLIKTLVNDFKRKCVINEADIKKEGIGRVKPIVVINSEFMVWLKAQSEELFTDMVSSNPDEKMNLMQLKDLCEHIASYISTSDMKMSSTEINKLVNLFLQQTETTCFLIYFSSYQTHLDVVINVDSEDIADYIELFKKTKNEDQESKIVDTPEKFIEKYIPEQLNTKAVLLLNPNWVDIIMSPKERVKHMSKAKRMFRQIKAHLIDEFEFLYTKHLDMDTNTVLSIELEESIFEDYFNEIEETGITNFFEYCHKHTSRTVSPAVLKAFTTLSPPEEQSALLDDTYVNVAMIDDLDIEDILDSSTDVNVEDFSTLNITHINSDIILRENLPYTIKQTLANIERGRVRLVTQFLIGRADFESLDRLTQESVLDEVLEIILESDTLKSPKTVFTVELENWYNHFCSKILNNFNLKSISKDLSISCFGGEKVYYKPIKISRGALFNLLDKIKSIECIQFTFTADGGALFFKPINKDDAMLLQDAKLNDMLSGYDCKDSYLRARWEGKQLLSGLNIDLDDIK